MRRPPLGRLGLPVLPNIYVASPCPADWSKMSGDERVRMCGQCNKHVFNLSQMSRSEAEELITEKHGNLCVRYYQRKDGTILLKDCTVAASAARKRQMLGVAAAALLATGSGFAALTLQRSTAKSPEAARILTPTPTEIDWRVREQALTHEEPPPPPPQIVVAPPELIEVHDEYQVTGGAVALSPQELDDIEGHK